MTNHNINTEADEFLPLRDVVFKKLRQAILTGAYKPGERLMEIHLADKLGVSRTPIREALRRLEQERLIKDSGRGSVVLGITLEDLMDIMDIRQQIEGLAAYYATKNITADELAEMQRISELQDFYYGKQDMERLRQMDDQFHDSIYRYCKRSVICDTLRPLHRKTQRYRKLSLDNPQRLAGSIAEHKGILQAIASGNAKLAADLTTQHIANAKEHMTARYDYNG